MQILSCFRTIVFTVIWCDTVQLVENNFRQTLNYVAEVPTSRVFGKNPCMFNLSEYRTSTEQTNQTGHSRADEPPFGGNFRTSSIMSDVMYSLMVALVTEGWNMGRYSNTNNPIMQFSPGHCWAGQGKVLLLLWVILSVHI